MLTANELVDKMQPYHSRTSCSDSNLDNGFYSYDDEGRYRCRRCALLQAARGDRIPTVVARLWEEEGL